MPGLTFLNPFLLWGMALGALPILIHLLQRRRYRVRRWAAMEFLRLSVRNTARRLRLEQLLLLLLRMAILLLVVLALSRPVARPATEGRGFAFPLLSRQARVHATVVIDNSYSMGYRPPTTDHRPPTTEASVVGTNFEQARERALELIRDGLRQGDSISVILAGDPPRALIRRPTFDLAGAARQIRAVTLSDTGTDFAGAARLCLETLKEAPHPNREVYLITDNQAVGWGMRDAADHRPPTTDHRPPTTAPVTPGAAAPRAGRPGRGVVSSTAPSMVGGRSSVVETWRALAARARLHVVVVGEAAPRNVAVVEVGTTRGLISTRSPAGIEARIANYGDQPQHGLLATLIAGDQARASVRVDLPPRGEATARFTQLFSQPGFHAGSVRVTPDRLTRDDQAFFRLRARDRVRVLCLNGRPNVEPQRDAAFYLTYALAPDPASPSAFIQPTVISGNRLGGIDLREYDVVILADVGPLGAADTRALEQYLQDGGGVLTFLGGSTTDHRPPTTGARAANETARRPGLPPRRSDGSEAAEPVVGGRWSVVAPPHSAGGGQATSLDPASMDHPSLARFKNAADVDLGTARFTRYVALTSPERDPSVQVICRFTNGLPALVEKRYGPGRAILVAASAGVDGNDLPYKPAYVPLMHQIIAYLAQGADGAKNLTVGERLEKALAFADQRPMTNDQRPTGGAAVAAGERLFRLTDPDGKRTMLRPASVAPGQAPVVRFDGTHRAGLYRLTSLDSRRSASREPHPRGADDLFAVNLPPGEGDLRPLDRAALARLMPGVRFGWIDPNQPLAAALRQARLGVELWRPLVGVVLVLMLVESFLAQHFGRG